ncbi:MAG: IS5/IS1182 family transposase, partial [Clostridia bacterium]|nr:IS5/IS1182 family transposase [Clostridia bacterium]
MTKLQKEYSRNNSKRQLVLPLETEHLIPKDAKVRLLDQVLEELNYKGLYLTYSDKGRNSAVEPVTLLKIMVLAYS